MDIKTEPTLPIDLALTVAAQKAAVGQAIVAGVQDVESQVVIDFDTQAPVLWMAAARKSGSVSANYAVQAFTKNTDDFSLKLNEAITVTHDAQGWQVPPYSPDYVVHIGFGLHVGERYRWAFSAEAQPNSKNVSIAFGGYELVRTTGLAEVGSVVDPHLDHWTMAKGSGYRLTFNGKGVGTLTPL